MNNPLWKMANRIIIIAMVVPASLWAANRNENSRVNKNKETTAQDQSNSSSDVNITSEIRKALTSDDQLSMNAKNAKVITQNGHVTLEGPVSTPQEKFKVEQITKNVVGKNHYTNRLTVSVDK